MQPRIEFFRGVPLRDIGFGFVVDGYGIWIGLIWWGMRINRMVA